MCNPPGLGSEYAITMKKGGSGNYIIAILFPIVCLFSSFSFFRNVNEWQIQGKWIGFVISFFIAAMLLFIIRFSNPCRNWSYGLTARICAISAISTNIAVAVICILQMADIIPAVSPFPATSDFDNPAGVAALMCATFPFSTVTDEGRMNTNVFRVFAVFALDIFVMCLLQSRAGMLGLSAGMLVFLFLWHGNVRLKTALLLLCTATVLIMTIFLFRHKGGSTSGRLLILDVCWQMIKDKPLLGHGVNGFAREYMLYQANYLKTVNSSGLLMLTDNITHPLNEFVLLTVNYGIIGLTALLAFSVTAVRLLIKQFGQYRPFFLMTVCSIGMLSLFSYPFRYPMTAVSLLMCIVLPISQAGIRIPATLPFILMVITVIPFMSWYRSQTAWKQITEQLSKDSNDKCISMDLIKTADTALRHNARYRYSRAVAEFYSENYNESLNDALFSREHIAAYDTELLIGEIYRKLGNNDSAVAHLIMASEMCPSRITPLYTMFKIYESDNDTVNMNRTGRELLSHPVKIQSSKTRAMRFDVRKHIVP